MDVAVALKLRNRVRAIVHRMFPWAQDVDVEDVTQEAWAMMVLMGGGNDAIIRRKIVDAVRGLWGRTEKGQIAFERSLIALGDIGLNLEGGLLFGEEEVDAEDLLSSVLAQAPDRVRRYFRSLASGCTNAEASKEVDRHPSWGTWMRKSWMPFLRSAAARSEIGLPKEGKRSGG